MNLGIESSNYTKYSALPPVPIGVSTNLSSACEVNSSTMYRIPWSHDGHVCSSRVKTRSRLLVTIDQYYILLRYTHCLDDLTHIAQHVLLEGFLSDDLSYTHRTWIRSFNCCCNYMLLLWDNLHIVHWPNMIQLLYSLLIIMSCRTSRTKQHVQVISLTLQQQAVLLPEYYWLILEAIPCSHKEPTYTLIRIRYRHTLSFVCDY